MIYMPVVVEREKAVRRITLNQPEAMNAYDVPVIAGLMGAPALIKGGMEGSLTMSLRDVMQREASHQSIMLQTRPHKDAVRAFLEARKRGKG